MHGELQTLLTNDSVLDVLGDVGYRGVPSKETLASNEKLVRYDIEYTILFFKFLADKLLLTPQ